MNVKDIIKRGKIIEKKLKNLNKLRIYAHCIYIIIPIAYEINPFSSIDACHFLILSFCKIYTKILPNMEIIKEKQNF